MKRGERAWGAPWKRHQGVRRKERKGKELGARKLQDLAGVQVLFHRLHHAPAPAHSQCPQGAPCWCWDPSPLPDKSPKAMVGQMPWSSFPGEVLSIRMCSCERGEVFTFEDLVFTITEKTAPNFFPEILIPPHAASSQGPNHWGDAGSCNDGNDGERGMAAVLSSDLTQCLGSPSLGGGVVPLWQLARELGEQSRTSLG